MSTWETFLLGGIAGSTIFLGLPMARIRGLRLGVRASMTAIATGILIFLLWDVLSGGVEPVEASLQARHWGTFALNREPFHEPPDRLLKEALRRGLEEHVALLSPGQEIGW